MPAPRRVFYGWYVVAAVFVITTTTSGLTFYNLSILLAAFVAERGFPVGLASSATATFFIAGSKVFIAKLPAPNRPTETPADVARPPGRSTAPLAEANVIPCRPPCAITGSEG